MKKRILLFLPVILLLTACNPKTANTPGASNSGGEHGSRDTGVAIHDNAPDLSEVGIDEFLFYFESSDAYVDMGEFVDERNPYEAQLAAEKEALGKNYIEFYNEHTVMVSAFENLIEKNLDSYNEDKDLDTSVYLYLTAFSSWELALGASFTEETDWAQLQKGVVMAFEMFGGTDVEVVRNAAHNYTISYTDSDGAKRVEYFRADEQNGIQMICYKDGELSEFFEFIHLGDDTYAWQSDTQRLVMRCKDQTVYSGYYSSLGEDSPAYTEAELIYGTSSQPDAAWVTEREDFHTQILFDGTTLEVTTINFFFGGVGHAVISPVK